MVYRNTWCGLPPKTYGLVIGWGSIVICFALLTSLSIGLGQSNCWTKRIADAIGQQFPKVQFNDVFKGITILNILYLIFTVICMISSAMLILGTSTDRHRFLVPWLTVSIISISLTLTLNCVLLIHGLFLDFVLNSTLMQVLLIYIVYGVFLLFKEIQAINTFKSSVINLKSTH